MTDSWDPAQYNQFEAERRLPFEDLMGLVQPVPGGRVVDLGCGTGALTADLHAYTGAAETVGVERSPAMLAEAETATGAGDGTRGGLHFEAGDIATWDGSGFDVVFANASLQWVPDHHSLLPRLRGALAPGGQMAFQVPANGDHPSHRLAAEIGAEEPFARLLGGSPPDDHLRAVMAPESYAELFDRLGATAQHARLQVYGHHLPGPESVVEWVRGTLLTPYRSRLGPADYQHFVDRYRQRLLAELPVTRPYFYAFKRILVWGRFDEQG